MLDRLLGRDDRPSAAVDLDTVCGLLSSPRRRWLIDHLDDAAEPLTKGDLAELLAFVESDVDHPPEVTSQARKRAYVSLHQTHLPELEDAGVIERTGVDAVRVTPRGEALAAINREVRGMCGGGEDG